MVTKGSVLVVDDEVNLCRILGAKLAKSGYNVVAVHDGMQAVEKVRESDFDVVLLDLILPKMDGLSALAEIRTMRNALPVIVMTACENADALEQAKSHGVSAYLNKPFDLDNLVTLINDTSQTHVSGHSHNLPDSTVLFVKDQPVTVEVQNGGYPRVYWSRICGKDDRTLSVLAPCVESGAIDVAPRTTVRVGLAARDAFYSFTSHVLKCIGSSEPVIVLDKPGVIYRMQRREFTRFPMRLPLDYSLCIDDTDDDTSFIPGETRDISMGGACIVVPEEVLPGEILKVEIRSMTEQDKISAMAHVLRSRPCDLLSESGYILGCRFTYVDESLRKLLDK